MDGGSWSSGMAGAGGIIRKDRLADGSSCYVPRLLGARRDMGTVGIWNVTATGWREESHCHAWPVLESQCLALGCADNQESAIRRWRGV